MSENKDWKLIDDIPDEELVDLEITFKLSDLKEWFSNFDRWWLQLNLEGKKGCVSREGIDYEPYFYGKIKD